MTIKKATEFTVVRDKWLRGEGAQKSYLLRRSDGKMCCMGFYALACGYDVEDIVGVKSLSMLGVAGGQLEHDVIALHDYTSVYSINDNSGDEKEIAARLAVRGVTVTFVDSEGDKTNV